jgi:hypothetical protein
MIVMVNKIYSVKRTILTGCLLILAFTNYAQICNGVNLDTMHGTWKIIPGGVVQTGSKQDLIRAKLNMESANAIIRKNWKWVPVGGDIFYGSFLVDRDAYPDSVIKIWQQYTTTIDFRQFKCTYDHKIGHESVATIFSVRFNDLAFKFDLSFYTPGPNAKETGMDPGTDVYAALHWLPEVKDGYFDYLDDRVDGTGNNAEGYVYKYRTIIKSGKLPYLLMSKKEYYEKWKKKYQIEIEVLEAQKIWVKKQMPGDGSKDILKVADERIAQTQGFRDLVDEILKNKSAEQLAQPAYGGEEYGEYYESLEASKFKSFIVKPNIDYYNRKFTDKSSPQTITLYMRYAVGKDEQGNKVYWDKDFYNALQEIKLFDLLAEKLRPFIVQ